jgi:hypothetical protein
MKLEFRSEFYNIFNHTNYYLPSSGLGGTLGSVAGVYAPGKTVPVSAIQGGTPSTGGQVTSTFQPRIIQFGLKLTY